MSPGLVVKLRPSGPWRIGPDSGARNRVDTIYHSDSLYSAVTSAMSRLGRLEEWLAATARSATPAVCFSSCFPFLNETNFVVPPRTIWPPASSALVSSPVRWKSARFVPLSVIQAVLAGRPLKDNWSVDGPSGCLVPDGRPGPFRTAVRSSAAVDRLTGVSERHAMACLEFRDGAGLWTVVGFADETARGQWQEAIKTAFRLLADSGFGGERSRGWGRSEAPEFFEGSLPELIVGAVVTAPKPAKVPASETSTGIEPANPVEPAPEPAATEIPAPIESAQAAELAPDPSVPMTAVAPTESAGIEPPAPIETAEAAELAPDPSVPMTAVAPTESAAIEPPAPIETIEVAELAPDPSAPMNIPAPLEPPAIETSAPIESAELAPGPSAPMNIPAPPEPAAIETSAPIESAQAAEFAPDPSAPMTAAAPTEPAAIEPPTPIETAQAAELAPDRTAPMTAVAPTEPAAIEPPAPIEAPNRSRDREGAFAAPAAPSRAASHWLLSLFTPAESDSVDWARGNYTVLARGGRVDSPAGSGELKKQIQMVTEGSVLVALTAPKGSASDVAPEGFAHPVFRAGFALAIPLPEGN